MKCFNIVDPREEFSDPSSCKRYPGKRSWSTDHFLDAETPDFYGTSRALSDQSFGSFEYDQLESGSRPYQELRVFTYDELKFATRNFFRADMLGEGGFGCVFKGHIRQKKTFNGETLKMAVAVKQLNRKGLQGHKEWFAEVNLLGRLNHPNLVKLVGYCAEDNERGMQRLLVYEYMPNKSLEDHLFHSLESVLSWRSRICISLGAARGLAYLHEEMDFQIIFRDFKTPNILLDKYFSPKLSDFGLARQGPGIENGHVTTAVVGTVGYAAPEYIQTGHLTTKSDVWSFGVVLLELLTGRKAIDRNRPKNEQRLLHWVKPYLADNRKLPQMLDPRLKGQYSLRAAEKLASIASQCLRKNPRSRPKMSEIVRGLQEALDLSDLTIAPISIIASPQKLHPESNPEITQKVHVTCRPKIDSPQYAATEFNSRISQKVHMNCKPRNWILREAVKFTSLERGSMVLHKLSTKKRRGRV